MDEHFSSIAHSIYPRTRRRFCDSNSIEMTLIPDGWSVIGKGAHPARSIARTRDPSNAYAPSVIQSRMQILSLTATAKGRSRRNGSPAAAGRNVTIFQRYTRSGGKVCLLFRSIRIDSILRSIVRRVLEKLEESLFKKISMKTIVLFFFLQIFLFRYLLITS